MPKSTVADWIEDFNVYIPKIKQGNVIYYKPEAIEVLDFIRKCREQNYQKPQIMQLLADEGFPITVEDAVDDVRRAIEGDSPRDTLVAVMQTMGQAMTELTDQKDRLNEHEKALEALIEQQSGQDERLNEFGKRTDERLEKVSKQTDEQLEKVSKQTDETNRLLTEEIRLLKEELLALKEEKKKGFFSRLFNLG